MTRPLDPFEIEPTPYDRPNQNWVCGRVREGSPCHGGPDAHGHCQATFECQPYKRRDRWFCSRPSGPCSDGPLPDGTCCLPIPRCQPVRSLRSKRRVLTQSVFALVLGLLLFMLNGDDPRTFVSPGELTFHHIAAVSDCSDCHGAAEGGILTWVDWAFRSGMGIEESRKCLACHNLGPKSLFPHGRPVDQMARLTGEVSQGPLSPSSPQVLWARWLGPEIPKTGGGEIACTACHIEHQGLQFDMKNLSNSQCAACHKAAFTGLAEGHPEFKDYPYRRRTRIAFNHVSHLQEHFPNAPIGPTPFDCNACHLPDASNRYMLLRGFEVSCGRCHAKDSQEGDPLPVLNVPFLDTETLNQENRPVGDWPPVDPDLVYDPLTPFMMNLLAGDPQNATSAALIHSVSAVSDLSDLGGEDEATWDTASRFAGSVKALYEDLSLNGHSAWKARLEKAGTGLPSEEIADLAGMIPLHTFLTAVNAWFPHLQAEMESHRAGAAIAPVTPPDSAPELPADPKWAAAGGWSINSEKFTLDYRPSGHADRFLRAWLDWTLNAKNNAAAFPDELLAAFSDRYATGRCLKCHTVEKNADGKFNVNWNVFQPDPNDHPFTEFHHMPHFSLGTERCLSCHALNLDSSQTFAQNYAAPELQTLVSNFMPISRSTCIECHTSQNAGDSCLTCHNYHTGRYSPTMISRPITARLPKSATPEANPSP